MNLKGETQLPKPAPRQVDPQILAHEIVERLTYRIGKDAKAAKPHDWLHAVILSIRDRVTDAWIESTHKTYEEQGRRVGHLLDTLWYVHTMNYYLAIKQNEVLRDATTWLNGKVILMNERI